jgi:hypothetical protein
MSIQRRPGAANARAKAAVRARRSHRVNLRCEPLEFRQLLSADVSGSSIGQISASPALIATAALASGPTGLAPQQIQDAYGINLIAFSGGKITGNGAGETIAIVDAYKDPNIASDLAAFDKEYGLQAPPSFIVDNLGATTTDAGWALETSLDVEWAHAIAPGANIILVEAASSSLESLFRAASFAGRQAGVDVVSMSWGTQEFPGESAYDSLFTTPAGHNNVTYVAASGDAGAWFGPEYPAVSPNVLAVGGTTLILSSGNTYGSESGWSGSTGGFSGLDSNFWSYEPEPAYQSSTLQAAGLAGGVRTTPDVSFNADPASGMSVYDSTPYDGQSGWFQLGGTSAATPAWAGLLAIADQGLAIGGKGPLSTTQALAELYSLPSADFNDITTGFNGYVATTGYDLVTGLGSPKANLLVAGLLAANGISESSALAAATSTAATSTATNTASSPPAAVSHHHVRHVHHARVHRADLPSSQISGTSSSGSSTSPASSSSTSTSSDASGGSTASGGTNNTPGVAGPLAPLAVAGTVVPASGSRSTSISPSGTNTSSLAQGAALPGTLGQGFQRADTSGQEAHEASLPEARAGDIDHVQAPAADSEDLPVPDPEQTPEQAPAEKPVAPAPPLGAPSWDALDEAIEQVSGAQPAGAVERIRSPADRQNRRELGPDHGFCALVGTAALAAGGVRFVLRRTDNGKRRAWWSARFPMT